MIEFDVFCLKLHRWELLQKINEEMEHVPAVLRENGKKLYQKLMQKIKL